MTKVAVFRVLSVTSLLAGIHLNSFAETSSMDATSDNLDRFELPEVVLSEQERWDTEKALELEQNAEAVKQNYKNAEPLQPLPGYFKMSLNSGSSSDGNSIDIEIYQFSKKIGQQFLIARQNGFIRHVFAISAGGHGKTTPTQFAPYMVDRQRWRHMSTLYPGTSENNMDHVSYFYPAIGFHATTFGLYSKLGRPDSHGCIRLARPEARAIFTLIKENGLNNTSVYSYPRGTEPDESEIERIKAQLAIDLNFIKKELIAKNKKGDVPYKTYDEYYQFRVVVANSENPDLTLQEERRKKNGIVEILSDMDSLFQQPQELPTLLVLK